MSAKSVDRALTPYTVGFFRRVSVKEHDDAIISEAGRSAKMAAIEITSTLDNTDEPSASITTTTHHSHKRPASSTTSKNAIEMATTTSMDEKVNKNNSPPAARAGFAGAHKPDSSRESRQRANPSPLGLLAFALTTFVLSCVNVNASSANNSNSTSPNIVVPLALGYGGLVQLLAGMWEMAASNTFGATTLSSYGGFWISYGVLLLLTPTFWVPSPTTVDGAAAAVSTASSSTALGLFLIAWFVFSVLMTLLTLRSTLALLGLFLAVDMTFLLLTVAEFAAGDGRVQLALALTRGGGVFGLITALLAWYNALAGIADETNFFFEIPVYHFPWSEKVMSSRAPRKAEKDMV